MKIASWNVNGLRAVARRGFTEWLQTSGMDIMCLQEIKVSQEALSSDIANIQGYNGFFNHAEKSGYAGTAVYTKTEPLKVRTGIFSNERFNREGRSIYLEFGNFSLLNVYMPHGVRDKSNLGYKLEVYKELITFLNEHNSKPLIIVGDFNIAHKDIDLARPKQNRNNTMFTTEEREQLNHVEKSSFIDSYRLMNEDATKYTWWPYMANARERDIGWRIDYIFVPKSLRTSIKQASIMPEVTGSDHCPTMVELEI